MNKDNKFEYTRRFIGYGILLLLLGLITGFLIPLLKNPRLGLSSHLEGVLNGMLLIIFGLIWPKLTLTDKLQKWSYALALFGTYTNWFTTLLAGLWGAGSELMPIAGASMQGSPLQEIIIKFGLISLSVSMISVCVIILLRLRGKPKE